MVEFCAGIIVGACLSYIAIIISLDMENRKTEKRWMNLQTASCNLIK